MEEVCQNRYQRSYISKYGTIEIEISRGISSAAAAFKPLTKVWSSTAFKTRTKAKIRKSNVPPSFSVILNHGRQIARRENRLTVFEGRSLERMLRFRW